MLVRGPLIVRFLSVSRPDTWRVRRTRKPTSTGPGQAAASGLRAPASVPLPATPTSPAELLDRVGELRGLVAELADLTDAGGAWGMRVLRRNIELALLSPETLSSAQNQLDFIEELTGAVWDGSDARFRYAALPAATAEETCRRDARRLAIV